MYYCLTLLYTSASFVSNNGMFCVTLFGWHRGPETIKEISNTYIIYNEKSSNGFLPWAVHLKTDYSHCNPLNPLRIPQKTKLARGRWRKSWTAFSAPGTRRESRWARCPSRWTPRRADVSLSRVRRGSGHTRRLQPAQEQQHERVWRAAPWAPLGGCGGRHP